MVGWILFAGLAGFLIGAIAMLVFNSYILNEMVNNGEIIRVEKKEREE